ncbi:coiled-coil domain-containing protein 170 [Aplochiton taeniatus]
MMENIDAALREKPIDELDACQERDRLKMRVAVLEETVRSCEVECKASRETVMRLVAETDREGRNAASSAETLKSLRLELDGVLLGKKRTELEKQSLMERLDASGRVTEASKQEAQCLQGQVQDLDRKVQTSQAETQAAHRQLQALLGKLASLLLRSAEGEAPTEREILQRVDDLCSRDDTTKMTVLEMESRLSQASEDLSRQTELHHSALQRAQLAEQQVQDLRERLQSLEAELLTVDVQRDGLCHNRQHYEQFLEQLSEKMKVDSIALDLGFDMRLRLILSRAEQLVKQEGRALVESKTLGHSLQRKLKIHKERLESKDLYTELLRRKVVELEEEKRSRSSLSVERDDAHLAARRMQMKVERLQAELKATKMANTELKAQLCHTNELKLKVMEQSQTLQQQRDRQDELEKGKSRVEKMLSTVSSDLQSQEWRAREDQQHLNTLRQTLAQLTERERELVDFRMVVSRMVGLDVTTLALPNYEIIKSLESLLHNTYHHLHHSALPWHCPTHQHFNLLPIQDSPHGSPTAASCQKSVGPGSLAKNQT